MTAKLFVDTNVLLYAASNAAADQPKRSRAEQVLRLAGIGFSAQVAQEFYDAASRKKVLGITDAEAREVLRAMRAFPVLPVTLELVEEAIAVRSRFQTSYWDAAILAAAKRLGCTHVFSEDFTDGQDYFGVKVVNPFRGL